MSAVIAESEDMTAEELVEVFAKQRVEIEKAKEQAFFSDIEKYVPIESKYVSGVLMATGWVMMAWFKYKKF